MYLPTLILTLAVAVSSAPVATPSAPSLTTMQSAFASSEQCKLPAPKASCSGASRSDIIVTYNKDIKASTKAMLLNAAKAAGGDVVYEWRDFGFSGFVPDGVVALLKAHSEVASFEVYENACVKLPVCGEGPC